MKRIICLLLTVILVLALLVSCDNKSGNSSESEKTSSTETELKTEETKESSPVTDGECESKTQGDVESKTQGDVESETQGDVESETQGDVETESNPDVETESTSEDSTETSTEAQRYTYIDFTSSEKALFNSIVGAVIPFLPNNQYFVEEYTYDNEIGVNFYTVGNTQAEFDAYRALFSDYTYDGTEDDENGDAWYFYSKGDVYVDMSFCYIQNEYVADIYVYVIDENGGETETETDPDQGGEDGERYYTDFTSDEEALFKSVVGIVIPFLPNDYYFVEEYSYQTEVGVNFYTFGNTQAEFDAYRALFSDYTYDGTEDDEYGDAWYFYSKGDVYVDMTFYYYEGEYIVDIYVYIDSDNAGGDNTETDGGNDNTEIDYGSLDSPVSTTYAHDACAGLSSGESSAYPFYVQGTVTSIGQSGSYYKNVYFTDGKTEMLIYTINMGSGISGFEVGDTITAYGYIKNYNGTIEMATYNGSVYVYVVDVEGNGGNQGGNTEPTDRANTDFKSEEKDLLNSVVGIVIPFIPNDEYYVEEYTLDNETGVNFYTYGNTQAEFDAYRALFSDYTYDGTEDDYYGDAWYFYYKGNVYVDMTFYFSENEYIVDIYVYIFTDDSGNIGGGEIVLPDDSLITNNGQGLPEDDGDGVFDVDFTKGQYVQNVTDQGYYIDGCPTVGSPAVLVIPVEFSDVTAASKGYTVDNLEKIFNGSANDTCYYSVHDYFYISSYNKLDLDITVVDSWFCPQKDSQYYANATYDYYGDEVEIGDQLILDEALAYLSTVMDLSKFDSDKNGVIDAVVMVYTLDIDENVDFQWAYRYWNIYADDEGYYYEYDGVSANDYVWISYEFMFEGYDENDNLNYDTSNPLNSYTFIHEFSHVLGADDYYDTSYNEEPMGGLDMMDSMVGDHNAYTKFNYGWLTTSRLVVTDSTVTLTLDAFVNNGDTIILANNWDETLGAYQEYYIIAYYTGTGLNAGEGGYFLRDGIVVYHVNASLYAEDYEGETYYDVYNNNTSASDQYGTVDNLIEYVKSAADNYTYVEGDSLPTVTDDLGNTLGYTFTVDELTENTATITFTKK